MLRQLSGMMLLGLLTVVGAGCCCVQGMPSGGMYSSSCDSGCPPGPLMGLASCGSGCGEIYVDEWISEPPVVDNCGSNCGGCATCRRPVRNVLRQLWGRPYLGQCDSGMCSGGGGDCGCDSLGGESFISDGYAASGFQPGDYSASRPRSSCNCGASHADVGHSHDWSATGQVYQEGRGSGMPPAMPPTNNTPRLAPEIMPAPEPEPSVAPTSATRRLNPATRRR